MRSSGRRTSSATWSRPSTICRARNVALRLSPINPVPGTFRVGGTDGSVAIGGDNAARYTPYVTAMDAIDSAKLVAIYVRLYPLFQQAYAELGLPVALFQ